MFHLGIRLRAHVTHLVLLLCLAVTLTTSACAASATKPPSATATPLPIATTDFAAVDPSYIYDQLFYMATHFQSREAGYPDSSAGHDGFAAYWAQEITRNLQGFGPTVRRDPFAVRGWAKRPTTLPAFNVEVTVPGVTHPEQIVVIGCHYDGEANSTQSANDDASGCAIELGVAKALGEYWRQHHVAPARTLRFVIFDAEEQGIYGSFHYLDSTINGDVNNVVAMFNEEQNGIAYPLRYLGSASNPTLPFYINLPPLTNNTFYQARAPLTTEQHDHIVQFRALMAQAVAPVFAKFRALGFQTVTYHASSGANAKQQVFTPDQTSYVQQQNDTEGGSDQIPFTLAGLPSAMFVGNSTYYNRNPPPWSFPFDQPQDTIQLMNTFASGSSQKAQALVLALGLPGMLTTWMLHQPLVLGEVALDDNPVAAISDVGITQMGKSVALDAAASYAPNGTGSLSYSWSFDDGATASGVAVSHIYARPGTYTLKLTVKSAQGMRVVTKMLHVVTQPATYPNMYAPYQPTGVNPVNPAVHLPTPTN